MGQSFALFPDGHPNARMQADRIRGIRKELKGGRNMVRIEDQSIVPGDARFDEYVPNLLGKRVALFSNHTVAGSEVIDTMLNRLSSIIFKLN